MVRPGGFEPPTTWFVARYSIQLSYGRSSTFGTAFKMVRPGGFEPPTTWFVARYSIQLSYGRSQTFVYCFQNGAPERIRTSDHLVRSQVLYPAELRALMKSVVR